MMEALLSFLRWQVGLRTDAADPAGSLHAKVKEARDTIVNTELPKLQKPRSGRFSGTVSTTSTSRVTLLNVTGKGRLIAIRLRLYNSSTSTYNYYAYIQIDGIDIASYSFSFAGSGTTTRWPGLFAVLSTEGYTEIDVNFNSSLKVDGYVEDATRCTLYVDYVYEKED